MSGSKISRSSGAERISGDGNLSSYSYELEVWLLGGRIPLEKMSVKALPFDTSWEKWVLASRPWSCGGNAALSAGRRTVLDKVSYCLHLNTD